MITIGLESLLNSPPAYMEGKRLGLLTNQASVVRDLAHGRNELLKVFGSNVRALYSPQHGFFSEKQDNMVESADAYDDQTGLPIYSLYGSLRKPNRQMFEGIDILLIDLVDVGTRVYTFLYTMANCLQAAAEFDKKVVVLDRPNPIGGLEVEGNLLEMEFSSFVGMFPLPMRHGMTLAELALYINKEFSYGTDLEVVPMIGWQRSMLFAETGFPWVFPSPNMPAPDTALVYPGQVIWEGTNISEGRGTSLPFQLFGAPFLDHNEMLEKLDTDTLQGCYLRPLYFQPTFGKWAGEVCTGFQLHVTDHTQFRPYKTSLALLQNVMSLYPDSFHYKDPPYEYEYTKLPIDLILGSGMVRQQLENGTAITDIEKWWQEELRNFLVVREHYLLYQ